MAKPLKLVCDKTSLNIGCSVLSFLLGKLMEFSRQEYKETFSKPSLLPWNTLFQHYRGEKAISWNASSPIIYHANLHTSFPVLFLFLLTPK